ncbi:MAG TPA: SpoIID/LytB domain-containing protein [Gaiellaceae bacterium]|nr:SpoIID/LytB domain-containing protein [Gaiellaceae bacterium]
MGRLAVLLAAAALLAGGGAAAAFLAPGSRAAARTGTAATTTGTTTITSDGTATSTASRVVAFTGHGWGHGLGLSQWGAYGYAQHGLAYDSILAHYYPGTTLGRSRVKTVRVLVAQKKSVRLTATAAATLSDGAGAKTTLEAGTLTLDTKLSLDGKTTLEPPLTLVSREPLSVDGRTYRGRLVILPDGKQLDVVDTLSLETYLKGVVPAEMPSAWAPEALKAQAVAARSYALANLAKGRPFDLYGDTRSQMYGGVAAESAAASAAVDATKGQVVLYDGKVADTLFFSTSGGRTASALESTGIAVPYLVPVDDPYDSLSPYHDWGPVLYDATAVAKRLKLSAPVERVAVANGPSGRVKTMAVTSDDDAQVTLTGNQVRSALGLRSTWFAPALLQLLPVTRTMTYGGAVSLTGYARGAAGVSLEARPAGGAWVAAGALRPAADGTFAAVVGPQVSTWYRLAWGTARAGLAKITVAARVSAVVTPTGVQGTLRPVAPGSPVQLQQKADAGGWTTLSATTADTSSAWSFGAALGAGTYRVRAAPGHGVAAGVSAAFTVQ